MPKTGLSQTFELQTRSVYTKVGCHIELVVDGKELPSMEVLGKALEDAIFVIQSKVTESYQVVPERTNTPIETPVPIPGVVNVPVPTPTPQPQPIVPAPAESKPAQEGDGRVSIKPVPFG